MYLSLSSFISSSVYGEVISVKEIQMLADEFDGKTVEVKGEIIGHILKEKEGYWFNILEEGWGIGVFVSNTELVNKIKNLGSYHVKGDIILVKGTFYKEFPLGKQRCIVAEEIKILQQGGKKEEIVAPWKIKLCRVFSVTSFILAIVYFIKVRWKSKLRR